MSTRVDYIKASPECFQAMLALDSKLKSKLDHALFHLVKLRASQINGCAYCIDMHWKDARAGGETEQRLYGLAAWRESPYYTNAERAALEWTECLTRVEAKGAPDAAYDALRPHFNDAQIADLSWTIAAINAWNRMGIGFQPRPGVYQPPKHAH
ncbi:MAG: carboxymuconolactone decarboxylase family protein [Tepidisphaera sp.]|nr:carboxymuconolactone decarboxylase family protein [Tepidisphaera sp.]